jgi:AbrB family looped-hinge helix DNA binding protein
MLKVRLSSKGQVVLPKAVRDAHGLAAGDELIVENLGDEIVLRAALNRSLPKLEVLRERLRDGRPVRVEDIAGVLHQDGPPVTIEDMDTGIAGAVTDRDARSRY